MGGAARAGWASALLAFGLCGVASARAEAPAATQPPAAVAVPAPDGLVAPSLLRDSPARYPSALLAERVEGEVWLELVVEADGSVGEVTLLRGAHPQLDEAALAAAPGLQFSPATDAGAPVAVRIQFSYRFVAPAPQADARQPAGALEGQVRARGTRQPIAGASVLLDDGLAVRCDADGRFRVEVAPGPRTVRVHAPGYHPAVYQEQIADDQRVEVVYALEPRSINPYETIVRAERERTEVARVALREQEVREVPGTMGDPFRVVMLMPGVGSFMSGVAYPVVRGSAPASSGYFLDGIRVPILFHLFLGPAVVHPDFVSGIDFYPGAPPSRFGRMLGGVIDGRIGEPREKGLAATAYADLLNAGAFVEYPFESTGTKVALAGRFSYTAWLAAMAANALTEPSASGREPAHWVLDFWDYQGRIEQRLGAGKLRLLAFGSNDRFGTESDDLDTPASAQSVLFHRADLRWRMPMGGGTLEAGATWGLDELGFDSQSIGQLLTTFAVDETSLAARLNWQGEVAEGVGLTLGSDLDHRRAQVLLGRAYGHVPFSLSGPVSLGTFAGIFSEVVWKPDARWTIVPGLRLDNYRLVPGVNHVAPEPRLTVRRQLFDGLVLKGAAGLYHQQPITLIHVPVISLAALQLGLQQALQFDVGAEWKLLDGLELCVDLYVNPLLRTLELNPFDTSPGATTSFSLDDFQDPQRMLRERDLAARGWAYGFELLLRHPLGGNWFGWLSYSLQRSTRWSSYDTYDSTGQVSGRVSGWLPYVFDQTHLVNLVLSYKLGHWTLGGALHFNTGRPETGVMTSSTMRISADGEGRPAWVKVNRDQADRLPGFFRADVRVARAWAFESFQLEAYLDVLNVSFSSEVLAYSYTGGAWGGGGELEKSAEGIPIVLPVIGVKGRY